MSTEEGKALQRWADVAQFRPEHMPEETRAAGGGVRPAVRLVSATPDPLGVLGMIVGIYKGKVHRSLATVTDDERREALEAMLKTKLNGPMEAIQFVFLIEGVSRSFTHQAVRSRFSFFAQESLRFAVVDDEPWLDRISYPPSLAAAPVSVDEIMGGHVMSPEERDYAVRRDVWDEAVLTSHQAYKRLVDAGIPSEDARGLMPHAMGTRYVWVVSLRTLLGEAGKRLCTQAQFEWRAVLAEVVRAMRTYESPAQKLSETDRGPEWGTTGIWGDTWQFEEMAKLLQPACYQEGRCGFMAQFDRGCKIRDRVNANAAIKRPSSEWGQEKDLGPESPFKEPTPWGKQVGHRVHSIIPAVRTEEWLLDPDAARVRPGAQDGS